MKILQNFHLSGLVLAVVMAGCIFACPASALTSDQVTEIKAVAVTGDLVEIEAITQTTVKDAITVGELPGDAAEQVTRTVVTAAKEAGKDTTAIANAANAGAISGAVAAAMATGQDPEAFAKAAMAGSNQGISLALGTLQTPSMLEPEAFTRPPRGVTSSPGRTFLPPPTQDDRPGSRI
ncbi:MAG: hypothetical protein RBR67_04395 [Desulfobacterium sp.]|nr:hypothetical protein [Desulfobacterium sp.]